MGAQTLRLWETPSYYYRYLSDKRKILADVTKELGKASKVAAEWLIAQHSLDLETLGFPPIRESIMKLLDEINFGGKGPSD
jgi:hypothetical protein